jgi:conjugal transfer/entry exclusion protein
MIAVNSCTSRLKTAIRGAMVGLTLTVAVGVPSLIPQEAKATGFPTVDIAALIQRILTYITQLSEYSSQITSTTTEISQLMQLYRDYEQTLREYERLLAQIRGLKNFISDADWNTLLASLEPYYGNSWFSAIPALDYHSSTFKTDLRTLYGSVGGVSKTTGELSAALVGTGLPDTTYYETINARNENLFSRQWDRDGMIAANRAASDQRYEDVQALSDRLADLGDESEVASLQFIAFEMNKMLHFQNEQMAISNQQLMMTDLESTRRAQQKAESLDREIARLKRVQAAPIDVTDYANAF